MSLLIITIILAAFAATSSFLEIEKKSKFYIAKYILVTIFFLGTSIASIFQFKQTQAESIKSDKKDSAFAKSQSDIISLQKINKKESDSLDHIIISLNNKLNNKTEDLLNSSEQTRISQNNYIKYSQGSDLPVLGFTYRNNSEFTINFHNDSKYPIYNSRITIKDYDKILECPHWIYNRTLTFVKFCYDKFIFNKEIGTIASQSRIDVQEKYNSYGTHHYIVEFTTTSKNFIFYCIVNKRNYHFNYAYRVYELLKSNEKVFIKEIYSRNNVFGKYDYRQPNESTNDIEFRFNDEYWEQKFQPKLKHTVTDY